MAGAGDKRSELEEVIASWGLSDTFRLVALEEIFHVLCML